MKSQGRANRSVKRMRITLETKGRSRTSGSWKHFKVLLRPNAVHFNICRSPFLLFVRKLLNRAILWMFMFFPFHVFLLLYVLKHNWGARINSLSLESSYCWFLWGMNRQSAVTAIVPWIWKSSIQHSDANSERFRMVSFRQWDDFNWKAVLELKMYLKIQTECHISLQMIKADLKWYRAVNNISTRETLFQSKCCSQNIVRFRDIQEYRDRLAENVLNERYLKYFPRKRKLSLQAAWRESQVRCWGTTIKCNEKHPNVWDSNANPIHINESDREVEMSTTQIPCSSLDWNLGNDYRRLFCLIWYVTYDAAYRWSVGLGGSPGKSRFVVEEQQEADLIEGCGSLSQ
jgi:hypothetical protein